jgi:uncharacterized protein
MATVARAPERLRDVKLIRGRDGPLIYDLERTFVLAPPAGVAAGLEPWPDGTAEGPLAAWLRDVDLLTDRPAPSKREDPDAPPPLISEVSIDLPGHCNMGCTYCFEKPIFSRIGRMAETTVDKTLDFAFRAAREAPRIVLHFGSGEPVIEFRQMRTLVEKAIERGARSGQQVAFELTTNATLVTPDIARFFAEHDFNVRVSCDGPAEIHNRFRPMANGRDSYPRVERGLRILLEHLPDRLSVNSVFCSGTRLRTLWAWAKDLGIRHYHTLKVGSVTTDAETLTSRELDDFIEDNALIADDLFETLRAGQRAIDYQPLTKTIRRLMLPQPITRFCGVAGTYVGVAADGAIYPCFRHLGLEEYRLGDVETGVDDAKRKRYRQAEAAEVDSRPVCSSCWARYLCGGECYADSVVYGPDKLAPLTANCPFWRAEIAEAIRLYDRLRGADPLLCLALFVDDVESIVERAEESARHRPSAV